jgi:hypothetical protein
MRISLFAAGAVLALGGCASSSTSPEERQFPDLTARRDLDQIHARCKQSLRDWGFPTGGEDQFGIWGPWVKDKGFSWRLSVTFEGSGEIVRISANLGLRREPNPRPLQGMLRGASEAAIDDAMLEDANLEAVSRDRKKLEDGDTRRVLKREGKIRELGDRVAQFWSTLEDRLTLPLQEKGLPPVYP